MSFTYSFPCVKGTQARSSYYICMIPCGLLSKLFPINDTNILPEFRAQRKLNEKRIPEIRDYILNHRSSYVFSALTASIDGEFHFLELSENVGTLSIDMNAIFLINDGQHRNAAIQEAIKEDPTLGKETIPVVFFEDKGLQRSQQMFTDLNKYAVKPSKSQNTFYDNNDPLAKLTKHIVSSVEFFRDFTDLESDSLGKYSAKIFTLNSFYTSNKNILRNGEINEEFSSFCLNYWKMLAENIEEWQELMDKNITKKSLREEYIITQNIVLYAFGKLGNFFYTNPDFSLKQYLPGLKKINWMRTNPEWENIAMVDGKISMKKNNITLTYLKIKEKLNIPLTEKEQQQLETR